MRGDQRRHHRLAGQIDAPSRRRRLDLSLLPDLRDPAAFDENRGPFDDRRRVAGNQPRAFVQRLRFRHGRTTEHTEPQSQYLQEFIVAGVLVVTGVRGSAASR